ncbi:MAG: hypothetical protein LBP22_16590 [Deltaproteobacteria bacterium]|nr:hypothetical protein [Deltaproteobacteria bacterium]
MTRLWAWPAVTGRLTPPGPASYLTWPAWEKFRLERLGETSDPRMTGVMIAEPPNFTGSLISLLSGINDGSLNLSLLKPPFFDPETDGLEAALKGFRPAAPARPYHLILALDQTARAQFYSAELLVRKARKQNDEVIETLKGPDPAAGRLVPEPSGPLKGPSPDKKTALAWFKLAAEFIRPGDLLWPAYDLSPQSLWPDLEPDSDGFFPCPRAEDFKGGL